MNNVQLSYFGCEHDKLNGSQKVVKVSNLVKTTKCSQQQMCENALKVL